MTRVEELDGLVKVIKARVDQIGEFDVDKLNGIKWYALTRELLNIKTTADGLLYRFNPQPIVPTEELEKEYDL